MHIVVFITAKDDQEAKQIGQKLVEDKLIACANIVKGIQSIFWWQNKVDQSEETLLILKTKKSFFPKIVKVVKNFHSYSVPEIIALPIVGGNPDYLKWINESIR